MLSPEELTDDRITELNADFISRIRSGSIKQWKLSNKGKRVPFSIEDFSAAAELSLED